MKNLLALIVAAVFSTVAIASDAPPKPAETKKVCVKTTDAKTGKEVEKCKNVKKHEKHEGTKVDGATKDKK